jgi:GT2 family glycosyltransferase
MSNPQVSILIPNYKTPDLTRICLRLIRKHTDLTRVQVIAIDNHSEDDSLTYLRSLDWITLLERPPAADDTPPLSHSRALDLALAQVNTPYVLSIHTDTFMHHPGWLDFLLSYIDGKNDVAGVGSWKLEDKPLYKRVLKRIEFSLQSLYYPLLGKADKLMGSAKNYYYLRSHCALYRSAALRELNTNFSDGNETAGKVMHRKLEEAGYKMVFLPSETLSSYIYHVNHATMVLNPELGSSDTSIRTGKKRVEAMLNKVGAKQILSDISLDQ